ncbi:MAG: 1-aminocyclopropane-1-carboxylate deaminase [Bacteroidia bacterium]|jgi:1-aminocyclopropane-1-carboxylate deaminase
MVNTKTPIQSITNPFFSDSGVDVFMKRDDLIHPFVSGNKWRKLKYNLQYYQETKADRLVTFGGAYSNHLIATAAACATSGIPCLGVVRGEELSVHSNYVLRLCHEFGMELKFISRSTYAEKKALYDNYSQQGFYVIPEGGDNTLGRKGCQEIVEQYDTYDHIIVAVGTGTTFSGVIEGSKGLSQIHGICAVSGGGYLVESVKQNVSFDNWKLHTDYSFGGFGKFDGEQLVFNRQFTKASGILVDPIYTGKMLRALKDLMGIGEIKSGESVLTIHSGGLTGLLSEKWLNG